jgi:alpha-glucosidase
MKSQAGRPDSMLELYREALHQRRGRPELGDGPMTWLPGAAGVLAFTRGDEFACVVNLSGTAAELPAHHQVLVTSDPLTDGLLPPDAAAWLLIGDRPTSTES